MSRVINKLYSTIGKRSTTREKRVDMPLATKKKTLLETDDKTGTVGGTVATSHVSLHCTPTREQVSYDNTETMDWTLGADVPNQADASIKTDDWVSESNHFKVESQKEATLEVKTAQSIKFDSFTLCKVLYNRTYSTSTNTSYASTPEAKAKKRSLRRRKMSREGYLKKLKWANDDEVFQISDLELRKVGRKQSRYDDAVKPTLGFSSKESQSQSYTRRNESALGMRTSSPTSSCRSEGNFSQRGQLKLVICGSERRLTVTVLEMKGLLQFSEKHSTVYLRMSLCPDDQSRERFKTSIIPVKSSSVVFHETFAFELTDDSKNRRLLISAWQKFDHHESSEFVGCMSFSVKKLKSNQRVIHGWYQLLGEMLGRRKHLAAKSTTCNHSLEKLDNSCPIMVDQRFVKSTNVQVQPLRDSERRSNVKHNENSITEYYKNLFDTIYSSNETNVVSYDDVPEQNKENSLNTHETQKASKKHLTTRREGFVRQLRSPSSIRSVREKSKTPIRRRQEERCSSRKRSPKYGGVRTPRRPRRTRDTSKSPALVVISAQVRSHRSKSARIISRRQQTTRQTDSRSTRLLYSDFTTEADGTRVTSENIRPVSISSQDETAANVHIRDLNATIVTHDNLNAIEKTSGKTLTKNSSNKTQTKGEGNAINPMPALPVTMYVNSDDTEAGDDLINTCLTMTKTGRVRAKKLNVRKATYLNSQKTFPAKIEQLESHKLIEDAAVSEKAADDRSEKRKNESCGYWFKISSAVDDDRGYTSDPEIDIDRQNLQIYRAWEKNNNNMSILSTPPPSILHSTHCRLKRYEALDDMTVVRTELEMLKLNAVSRRPYSVESMDKKRTRPSFLLAFLDPLEKLNKKKYEKMTESHKASQFRATIVNENLTPSDLSLLIQDSSYKAELEEERKRKETKTTIDRELVITKARKIFGSTLSLCSERSYRHKNAMITALRRLHIGRKDSFMLHKFENPSEQQNLLFVGEESTMKNGDVANGNIIARSYTDLQEKKENCDDGVYVDLSTVHKKEKVKDYDQIWKQNIHLENEALDNSTGNAKGTFGTLMTWLQRKSSESLEKSPSSFRRRSSISRKSTSRTSMRSRSSTRHEIKINTSFIEENGGSVTVQRKPRAATKDTGELNKSFVHNEDLKSIPITLEEILRHRVATQVFRDFLKSEYSEENLDFWLDCASYRTQKSSKQAKLAPKIFNQYLSFSAPREINIDFETRARTKEKLKKTDNDTFTEPQNCIYSLMKCDSFRRFQQSDGFLKIRDSFLEDLYKNQLAEEGKSGKRSFKSSKKKKSLR